MTALCWLATGRTFATFLGTVRSCAAGKKGQKEGEEAPEKSSKGSQEGQTGSWVDDTFLVQTSPFCWSTAQAPPEG